MTDERLINIEIKIAYQEDLLETLNDTVYQQQKKLERLEAICEALARQVASLADSASQSSPLSERPPHY